MPTNANAQNHKRKPVNVSAGRKDDVNSEPHGEIQNQPPTTWRAVTVESAAVNCLAPRSFSIYGAPRKTQRKQGTNVVQVVMSAPSVRREAAAGYQDDSNRRGTQRIARP